MKALFYSSFILCLSYLLNGCAAAVIGGAAAGISVAVDNRSTVDYFEDQTIKTQFAHAYYQDEELSEQTHVNVTSYNGYVLITGEALTTQQKQKLTDIVLKLSTVRRYFNEVTIGIPTTMSSRSNDSYITSQIKATIFAHINELDTAQVKVVTEDGNVYLMGLVSQQQANQVTEIARTTSGVKRVIKLFEYITNEDKKG